MFCTESHQLCEVALNAHDKYDVVTKYQPFNRGKLFFVGHQTKNKFSGLPFDYAVEQNNALVK